MLDFLNTITFIEVKGWIFKIYHIVLFRENFINEKHKFDDLFDCHIIALQPI